MNILTKATDTNFTELALELLNKLLDPIYRALAFIFELFSDAFSGDVWSSDPLYAIFALIVVILVVVMTLAGIGNLLPETEIDKDDEINNDDDQKHKD